MAIPGTVVTAALVGAMGALGILCALVALVLRDRLYAVFAASLACYAWYQVAERTFLDGTGPGRPLAGLALVLCCALLAWFARDFLGLDPRGRRWRGVLVLLGVVAAIVGASAYGPPSADLRVGAAVPLVLAAFLLALLDAGLAFDRRGVRAARWYALGALGLIVGLLLHAFGLARVIPPDVVTAPAGAAGVVWNGLFVALALADRVRALTDRAHTLEAIAFRDALTGIPNRRAFDRRLRDEWRRGARAGSRLAVILIDIDRFKAYNDANGHRAGDKALRAVAAAIARVVRRRDDLAARYGGEEFVVVLPGVRRAQAVAVADALREAVRELALPHPVNASGRVTISCGVAATIPRHDRDPERLVTAADRALYRAKAGGRDRTVAARPARPPAEVGGGLPAG